MKLLCLLFITTLLALFGCSNPSNQNVSPVSTNAPARVSLSTTPAPIPKHVLSAIYGYGYAGVQKSVPLSAQTPYVDWAYTDQPDAPLYQAAGVKTLVYMDFWRNYKSDVPSTGYNDLKPGGAHAAAESKGCNGAPSYISSYDGGYLTDPRNTIAALGHARVVQQERYASYNRIVSAYFSDDTDGNGGVTPAPCNYNFNTWVAATNVIDADLGVPMFVNGLNAWSTGGNPVALVAMASPSNVRGVMCESCYVNATGAIGGAAWIAQENAEIGVIAKHKIFWEYARDTHPADQSAADRTYAYASFLLTYAPSYAMYQPAFATPSAFEVMPEQGLVPTQPLTTSSTVGGYMNGTVAERRFAKCYFRGNLIGSCAVAINTGTANAGIPVPYPNSMVLTGGGVYEGGQANFSGPKVNVLAPHTAAVLVGGTATPPPPPSPTPVPTATPGSFGKLGIVSAVIPNMLTVQFGAGCGYLHVYTNGSTTYIPSGYTPRVNDTINVDGSGGCSAGSVTATSISFAGATPTPAPSYSFVKKGTVGGILETNITVNFGAGCGWTHVYTNGTTYSPTGYIPKVNDTITVYGSGGCTVNGVQAAKIVKD